MIYLNISKLDTTNRNTNIILSNREWEKIMKGKNLEQYSNVTGFEKITFGELIDRWGDVYCDRIAIKDNSREITYYELMESSRKLVKKLKESGVKENSMVVMQCINKIYFVETLFALFRMGTVPVMVLPAYREQEVVKIIKKTQADAYIAPIDYAGYKYENIRKEIKRNFPDIVTLMIDEHFTNQEEMIGDECVTTRVKYDDIAILLLSGGTTGEPKLIPRTHADYIYNAKMAAIRSCLGEESVYLASLSIAHNMPLACPGILGTLYAGGTAVLSYYSSPDEIMELIEEERVTITGLVPTLAQLCMELLEIEDFDISSLKVIITGGARLEPKLEDDILMEKSFSMFIGADALKAGYTFDDNELKQALTVIAKKNEGKISTSSILNLGDEFSNTVSVIKKLINIPANQRLNSLVSTVQIANGKVSSEELEKYDKLYATFKHTCKAVWEYQMDYFTGDLLILSCRDKSSSFLPDIKESSEEFIGKMALGNSVVKYIPGNHASCITPPFVTEVAKSIMEVNKIENEN